jgi:hypothetical protein
MSNIRVNLKSVTVVDGQGIGEGDLELRLSVSDGSKTVFWPSPNTSAKVENEGTEIIDLPVSSYVVNSGTLAKTFTIRATEVDKGLPGQDDYGTGFAFFIMSPTMSTATFPSLIPLKRPDAGANGLLQVTLEAERV